ncbi:MAG: spore photoproduct lyase family protein [Thermoanaerobaculia bacterium]
MKGLHHRGSEEKVAKMEGSTLLPRLQPDQRTFIRELAASYRFTFQELRRVAEAARDLEMWCEDSVELWWRGAENKVSGGGRERKKAILRLLEKHLRELAASAKSYPTEGFAQPPRRQVQLAEKETSKEVFGLCAAYSERTVCCGLHTIDAVRGCPFGCSYCTIQTFYGDSAELEADLIGKLAKLELDPERSYHIGSGQSSDSLVWGNRGGLLDALLDFADRHPNVLLELKTKSDNVRELCSRDLPANVICSWSLNPETVIDNEEHGTASLERRLRAARAVADQGLRVAFHFHPMIFYQAWRRDYGGIAERLLARFEPHEVGFVSMGSVTLIRPVVQEIRRRGGETKILQMELTPDPHGKLTYPRQIKLDLFGHLHESLRPWHREVFFYLCMETDEIWRQVFGRSYATNEEFELDFLRRCPPTPVPLPAERVSARI